MSGVNIAAVERETGLSKDTLRVWERRYGFPRPGRDRNGERLYAEEQVARLRVLSRLLALGFRPGQIVHRSLAELDQCVAQRSAVPAETVPASEGVEASLEETLGRLRLHNAEALRKQLNQVLLRLGLQRFVIEFAARLNVLVGEEWARGDLSISQEHLYTEQMQQVLRRAIDELHSETGQPTILLTTVPAEEHQIGLLMAQACLVAASARCVSLGAQTPISQIREAAHAQSVDAVGLSFSRSFKLGAAQQALRELRSRLDARIHIWAGGSLWERVRARPAGVTIVTRLSDIEALVSEYRAAHPARARAARR
jgi:DNA-binding transcriptional MerR regulator